MPHPIGPARGLCFGCGKFGHRLISCPKSTRGLFIADSEISNDTQLHFDAIIEENVSAIFFAGDTGPSLLVKRSFLAPKGPVDENVISKSAVDKLCLPSESHPHPYNLSWLECGNHVHVDKCVLVKFSVGDTYVDSIWCDVVPMDACQILLGRPWQFDRNVIHDGRKYTYSFIFSGVKIVKLPSVLKLLTPVSPAKVLFLNYATFLEEMSAAPITLLLLGHDICESSDILSTALPIIEELCDVFLDALPEGLPPLRDIHHQIDLIPGAPLPNRPHHHMSLVEHEELRRQVEDLLRKGLVARV
ncbi:uncharacterized protein LOC127247897 [Andrographis paniculata]|uniref:uncharacterized protein LOC127247897 n=1 Tax=Andrographis paniculata TaxID=175694 RepID=UPI0021E7E1B8|nr:uncharacterized protein LOC127247897 [Andrographis paniculata]